MGSATTAKDTPGLFESIVVITFGSNFDSFVSCLNSPPTVSVIILTDSVLMQFDVTPCRREGCAGTATVTPGASNSIFFIGFASNFDRFDSHFLRRRRGATEGTAIATMSIVFISFGSNLIVSVRIQYTHAGGGAPRARRQLRAGLPRAALGRLARFDPQSSSSLSYIDIYRYSYMYKHIYIYLSIYLSIYLYICIYLCIYIYIYI